MFLNFKEIIFLILQLILVCIASFTGNKKKVLMVVPNVLTFAYLKLIYEKLSLERSLTITFCFDKDIPKKDIDDLILSLCSKNKIVKTCSYRFAMLYPWSLIIFADVTSAHSSFYSKSKKIKVNHGLLSGKYGNDGYDVVYSTGLLSKQGEIAYDTICSPSSNINFEAINPIIPDFKDRLYFVGCLKMDMLLKARFSKNEIKESLNLNKNKKVVFLASSWGDKSLVSQWGVNFYSALKELSEKYQFIASVHPHNYKNLHHKGKLTESSFDLFKSYGGIVIAPNEDWVPYLVCSDILITDHTSLSLYFLALKKPIICLKLPHSFAPKDAPIYKLESVSTKVSKFNELELALSTAENSKITDDYLALAESVCLHQGEAWFHMREVIMSTLND